MTKNKLAPIMIFLPGKTYHFKRKKGWQNRIVVNTASAPREFVYVAAHGGDKFHMFQSPTSGWRETFTLQQLDDYNITEVSPCEPRKKR